MPLRGGAAREGEDEFLLECVHVVAGAFESLCFGCVAQGLCSLFEATQSLGTPPGRGEGEVAKVGAGVFGGGADARPNVVDGVACREQVDGVDLHRFDRGRDLVPCTFGGLAEVAAVEDEPGQVFEHAQPFPGAIGVGVDEAEEGMHAGTVWIGVDSRIWFGPSAGGKETTPISMLRGGPERGSGAQWDMHPPLPFASDDEKKVRPPRLPGRVVLRPTADDAYDALLADVFMQAMGCISAFGDFHFAISVTPTVEPILRRMLFDLSLRAFPWQKTRLWLADEIVVPEADESRRGLALHELLGTQSGIPEEQVHLIQSWKPDADIAYETQLRDVLGWREKGHDRLDAVLGSIGEDGSFAGLRPGAKALAAKDQLVVREEGSPEEIAMSLPMLNAARVVAVVATGKSVQPSLRRIEAESRAGTASQSEIPAARLAPSGGELRWYLDQESLQE